jgi:hypothetical protein
VLDGRRRPRRALPSTWRRRPDAAASELIALLDDPPQEVLDAMRRPPQTNEVGRSVALTSGLLVVADRTGLPLRLRELGSSAGLNLRLDAYWYAQSGESWGNPDAEVRFVDQWPDGTPPFGAHAEIVERRGCDRDRSADIDDGRLTLLSYVAAARTVRPRPCRDRGGARSSGRHRSGGDREWLPGSSSQCSALLRRLHSITWQYLSPIHPVCTRCSDAVRSGDAAGGRDSNWLPRGTFAR